MPRAGATLICVHYSFTGKGDFALGISATTVAPLISVPTSRWTSQGTARCLTALNNEEVYHCIVSQDKSASQQFSPPLGFSQWISDPALVRHCEFSLLYVSVIEYTNASAYDGHSDVHLFLIVMTCLVLGSFPLRPTMRSCPRGRILGARIPTLKRRVGAYTLHACIRCEYRTHDTRR